MGVNVYDWLVETTDLPHQQRLLLNIDKIQVIDVGWEKRSDSHRKNFN